MKNLINFLMAALLITLLAAGCGPKTEPVYLTGAEGEQIAAIIEPAANNILAGIEANDYDLFSSNFDQTMRGSITSEVFANVVKQFGKNGAHESIDLLNIEDKGDFYSASYGVNYPEAKMIMQIVVSSENPELVSGLWFK